MIDRIFSVDHAFGRLELYVFGQDWPKAIRSTRNSVDKGPTMKVAFEECDQIVQKFYLFFSEC